MEASSSVVLRLIGLHPVVTGAAATLLAAFAFAGWIAIGSLFLPRASSRVDDIYLAGSILIGSGITAFAYALLTRAGVVDGAIAIVAVASIAAIVTRRAVIRHFAISIIEVYREVFKASVLLRMAAIPIAILLWLYAVAPPRDGDVMRYHLAHIRQIISDGRWEQIADYHYAFPFGWSLNYLPFERLHLPQAAALVNVALWVIIVGGLLRVASTTRGSASARIAIVALFVHPFVVRTFASAMVDGYAIMAVYAIGLILLRLDKNEKWTIALLGFACWIGVQSRYQHIAWGVAGTCVFLLVAARQRSIHSIGSFLVGAVSAFVLSAPFYIVNMRDFGNAVWPLMIRLSDSSSYADRIAASYTSAMTGEHSVPYMLDHLWELVSTTSLIPVAIASILLVIAGLFLRDRFRRVAVCGALFFAIWLIAEPKLYPKHVLLLLPMSAMIVISLFDIVARWPRVSRLTTASAGLALLVFLTLSGAFSLDYARYVITGDASTYHRFTWYYPTYQWVNDNTPKQARILVIVFSGHSYYLDRQYRRADPWLSGVVDWSRVQSGDDLSRVLARGHYDYVIYDDRDWSGFIGGRQMQRAMSEMIASGGMTPVHEQREVLYTSRAMREFEATNVTVLRVDAEPTGA